MNEEMNPQTPAPAPVGILAAMQQAAQLVGAIEKGQRNRQQGFQYRGIEDIYNRLHTIFAQLGITTLPEVLDISREDRTTKKGDPIVYTVVKVRYTFAFAEDGSSCSLVTVGEGSDMADKSAAKAMSVAHKVALVQMLMVPTETGVIDDPDAGGEEIGNVVPQHDVPDVSPGSAMQVQGFLDQGIISSDMLMTRFGVNLVSELTEKQARAVIQGVEKWRRQQSQHEEG